jgi:MoaA/NifB/PqqE/SkfB family radical SAM enzyme
MVGEGSVSSYVKLKEIDVIPRLPVRGNLDITYRCNNNCLHCWLRVPLHGSEKQKELNTDEIKRIIDEAKNSGCKEWAISGGEPMLRPDFPEIFDYITKNSLSYSINTNGTLITPEIAELMKRKGRKMVALYGATAYVHDHITRNPGSFQATMKGSKLLQEAGAEFIVQIVPMKDNYHQLKEMEELAKSLSSQRRIGASWLFLSADGDPNRNEEIKLQRLSPREVIELDKPQPSDEESEQKDVFCSPEDNRLFASCIDHRRDFHVDPYGHMSFCSFIKDPSLRYDLREGTFQDCWDTFIPSLKNKTEGGHEYDENCGSCNLKSECRWCPVYGYLEHRRFSAPVGYLCEIARESKRFKDEWEEKHCIYLKCADISVKIESDLPITEETFHPVFYFFKTKKSENEIINIKYHFEIPNLNSKDLGDLVYQRAEWEVRRKGSSWIYLSFLGKSKNPKKIAIFNKEHTKLRIYTDLSTNTKENLSSFHIDDIFLTQISLSQILAEKGGFFLHSSGVIVGGKAILFVGHSGAGKSTIRNMALLDKNIKPLCNDRNIIRRRDGEYRAYGTWTYTENLHEVQAVSAPLEAIMFLEQAKENLIIPLEDRFEIAQKLLPYIIRPVENKEWWNKTLSNVDEIIREVPCYRLRFDLSGEIIEQLKSPFLRGW